MSRAAKVRTAEACPALILWVAVTAGALALLATYWDDGWHTVRGRDSLLIAPHILLYGSIAAIGISMVAWFALALASSRRLGIIFENPALSLALVGVAVTLGAAPIDDVWHRAFGRDAVAWSPPHLLGLVGTGAIGVAVLIEASRPARGVVLQAAAGGLVLGVLSASVFEYETEVPQFALVWYLPVAVATLTVGFYLLDLLRTSRWTVTFAALFFEGLRGAISLLLVLWGFSAGVIPIVLPSAALFDLSRRLGLPRPAAAALGGLSFVVIQSAYMRPLPAGLDLTLVEVLVGAAAAVAAALVMGGLVSRARLAAVGTATALILALVSQVQEVAAHDPGQGTELVDVQLTANSAGNVITLTAFVLDADACASVKPGAVVGRRAGRTIRDDLMSAGTCAFSGEITLPNAGLWFVYAEANSEGTSLEAWLPIRLHSGIETADKRTAFYAPTEGGVSATQIVSGAALYALAMAVAALCFLTVHVSATRFSARSPSMIE